MSRQFRTLLPPFLGLILLALPLITSQVACTAPQGTAIAQVTAPNNDAPAETLKDPVELVFAGQIAAADGRWLNDYVVVLFKNGREVARTTSRLQDSAFTDKGPMDGVFEVRVANIYGLRPSHEFYYPDLTRVSMKLVPGLSGTSYLGTWFQNLNPAEMQVVAIPSKQVEYVLVVLPMAAGELSADYAVGNLSLQDGILIIQPAAQQTAVPDLDLLPQSNIRFEILPKEDGTTAWNLQMTGFYGSRWEVWERFVAGRVPGMHWELFKEAVLIHNPHLEPDSYVFYPEKSYLLPLGQ